MRVAGLKEQARWLYTVPKGSFGNDLQWRLLARARDRTVQQWRSAERVIIVHTMGKVGSMALTEAIRHAEPPAAAVFHTHRLVALDDPGVVEERLGLAPRRTWFVSDALLECLEQAPRPCSVISVARDPVERNVSGFFQTIERYTADRRPLRPGGRPPAVEALVETFVERYPHLAVTRWLDREISARFGLDPYAVDFDHRRGWVEQRSGETTFAIARHDRLRQVGPQMLSSCLGVDVGDLPVRNVSTEKHISATYREFRQALHVPEGILDALYGSRYSTYFGFSPPEWAT